MTAKLLELVAAPENLLAAWRAVRGNIPKYRRQRAAGPDGVSISEFEKDLTTQLKVLRDMLMKGRYQPEPPAFFSVPKRSGGERLLAILSVRDRVAQRATQQVMEPLWEPDFLPCSFGFRPGISLNQAIAYVQEMRPQYGWVVDGDIATCFDTLDHDLLMKLLRFKVRDGRMLALMQAWLDAGIMQAGPPQNVDMQSARRIETVKNYARKGFEWIMDSITQQSDPYGYGRYSYYDDHSAFPATETFDQPQGKPASPPLPDQPDSLTVGMRRMALRQIISSGMMIGMGFVRARAAGLFSKAGTAGRFMLSSPVGRRLLKRGAMATGGLASLAAVAAVTTYLLNRKAGPSPAGVLQGSPLSPLLANVYLHPFDVSLTTSGHNLARFADDWVILCLTQDQAETAYNDALRTLGKLHLKANLQKTQILPPGQQLEWLGAVIR
jgi:RNA-directed DNA polymerase